MEYCEARRDPDHMPPATTVSITHDPFDALRRKLIGLCPAAAAIGYPFLLQAFHAAVSPSGGSLSGVRIAGAAILLALAFAAPLSGLVSAVWWTAATQPSQSDLRARRLAYAAIAVPPLFVFVGVLRGYAVNLLGLPVSDIVVWIAIWLLAGAAVWSGGDQPALERTTRTTGTLRVAHGVSAVLITFYVLFHLSNHLSGLIGPETHAAIMKAGRAVYRAPLSETVLVLALLFQAASGVRLAWHWSSLRTDAYRIFQIGSGAYLAAFLLAHLNSGLIAARHVYKIETDWAWAAGMPDGLIHGAWNIRLLPHYALGVFFILAHLASGLRGVMIAHGTEVTTANRVWSAGLIGAALIATAIVCALCGMRI
ncbi:hypothetical protein RHPLAN_55780 [Rhodoplanes sp. Z2-YC6860]|nr:hypothetical protein RHPLAN_55780 [Rhodoplanes sp. Z2-YC6860]